MVPNGGQLYNLQLVFVFRTLLKLQRQWLIRQMGLMVFIFFCYGFKYWSKIMVLLQQPQD
jgi:hypothetical protein